jgi:Methyltransferase domain
MNQGSPTPNISGYPASRAARLGGSTLDVFASEGIQRGIELEYPVLVSSHARLGHIPFFFWIADTLRPLTVVELGVGSGNSYCALLQAISNLGLQARCFGVDPWTGNGGEQSYRHLGAHHDPLYGAFSTLLRSSYESAAAYFTDGVIDLLHIGEAEKADAVSPDWDAWLPRMSSRGVVMFHDTNAHTGPPAIRMVWEDVKSRYPSFEFLHDNGLGVAYVGSEPLSGALKLLFDRTTRANTSHMRTYFARLGTSLHEHEALREVEAKLTETDWRFRAMEAELTRGADARRALEQELQDARAKLAGRGGTGHNLRQHVALVMRLQREVSTLNRQKIQWEQILASTSWRITAPLRWAVIKARWLLSKLAY